MTRSEVGRMVIANTGNVRLTYLLLLWDRFPQGQHPSIRDLQLGCADSRTDAPCHPTNSTCHPEIVALPRTGGKAKSREFNQLFRSFPDTPTWRPLFRAWTSYRRWFCGALGGPRLSQMFSSHPRRELAETRSVRRCTSSTCPSGPLPRCVSFQYYP
jgi:hypothetical protein